MNGFVEKWPEVIAGMIGAIFYFLTRYERQGTLSFKEYLNKELNALLKGFAGFFVLWVLWVYFGDTITNIVRSLHTAFAEFEIPHSNTVIAVGLGGFGKVFYDRIPRIIGYFRKKKDA